MVTDVPQSMTAKTGPRVAYVTGVYPAMSLTFIEREIEALRRQGMDIRTVAIRKPDAKIGLGTASDFGREEAAQGAQTHYLLEGLKSPAGFFAALGFVLARPGRVLKTLGFAFKHAPNGLKARLLQIAYFIEAVALARYVRLHQIDHMHNHFAGASLTVTMLASKLVDTPFSFTLHGPTDLMEPVAQQLGPKVAASRFVACISHYARSQCAIFAKPEHWSKLKIIHCGVQVDRYASIPREDDETRMLFVGRLAHVKGLPILFEALKQMGVRTPPTLKLRIVGDGPERTHLEALAAECEIDVTFTGFQTQDQVAEEMAACDFFVLPSLAEGVPVVLMEAMASRKPVIATRVAGVSELVEHGKSGLLTHAGDPAGLVDAILDMCDAPGRRQDMGDAGRAKVEAAFDIDDEAARLAMLFRDGPSNGARPGA